MFVRGKRGTFVGKQRPRAQTALMPFAFQPKLQIVEIPSLFVISYPLIFGAFSTSSKMQIESTCLIRILLDGCSDFLPHRRPSPRDASHSLEIFLTIGRRD